MAPLVCRCPIDDDVARELCDAERVVVGLGREAGEEVELHPAPTARERGIARAVEVFFGDELVDHLAHPPGAGLGREGQAGAADLLDLGGDPDRERVDAQRRERDTDASRAFLLGHEVGDDIVDPGEVGRRQRRERDLVVAGATNPVTHHRAHLLLGSLAHGTRDHPGLAEAAPARAPAEHLDVEPVVHDLDERDQLVLRIGPLGEVGDGPLLDRRRDVGIPGSDGDEGRSVVLDVVQGRHVHASHRGELAQDALPAVTTGALPRREHGVDLADDLFAVADDEGVDEVGQRLRVERAVPAGDDERDGRTAVLATDGDAGEVDAVQEVRVDELGGEVEGEHVERVTGAVGLDREQRDPFARSSASRSTHGA